MKAVVKGMFVAVVFSTLQVEAQAQLKDVNDLKTIATLMRASLPSEAKCEWTTYGEPLCMYKVENSSGYVSLKLDAGNQHIDTQLRSRPGGNGEQNRVGLMLFTFLEKLGFSKQAVMDCFARGRGKPDGAEIISGTLLGECSTPNQGNGEALFRFYVKANGRF